MSTDTFSDIEARLRADLPRLADEMLAVDADRMPIDGLRNLEPARADRRARRWLVPAAAVAAALVLIGVVVAVRATDRHEVGPVDVGPAPVEAGWVSMAPSPLSPREAAVSVWTGTEVIVWGGRVGNMALLDGAAYNPATDTWRPIASNSWGHPAAHAVWAGDRMVVLAKNGGAAYEPATDTWHDLPRLDDGTGSFLAPVWTGTDVVGIGIEVGANDAMSLTASTLAPTGDRWQAGGTVDIGGNVFAGTDRYRVVWTGTEAVVWDGVDRGWAYDPATQIWRALPGVPTLLGVHEDGTVPVAAGGELYLVKSVTTMAGVSSLLALRATADRWVQIAGSAAGQLDQGSTVAAVGDTTVVLTGSAPPITIDLATGDWSEVDPYPILSAVGNRSATATDTELVLWGGTDASGSATAQGWRWRP